MVRGRRVRAVVACTRTEDCCSPLAKRREQQGGIVQFFGMPKGAARRKSPPKKLNGVNGTVSQLSIFSATPPRLKQIETGPPTTPHRIELCSEVEEMVQNGEESEATEAPLPVPVLPTAKPQPAKKKSEPPQSHKLTEYFPVRRSVRKTKKTVLEEKQRCLEHLLRHRIEEGLKVQIFEGKGRGVVAAKSFEKGDFVVEYSGDLIDIVEAKKREQVYAKDHKLGCYMYYFKYKGQQYCVDATEENGTLGRLVNHSRTGNLVTRTVCVDNTPRLVLLAKNHIKTGDELTYDYGDRSKESLQYHPWLAY